MTSSTQDIAAAHDAMADEYDRLDDLWYPWLFSRIHELIASHLPSSSTPSRVCLDVGCGTGFQSFLMARAGHDVTGFDVSTDLLEVATSKIPAHAQPPLTAPSLFATSTWPGIQRHHDHLARLLETRRGGHPVSAPRFLQADATLFDYGDARYDVINCCGSVLSFIDDYAAVLARMAEGLKQGGLLFLEVEQKVNVDLLWPIVDKLLFGRLGYEQSWSEIVHGLTSPGRTIKTDYPFELQGGGTVVLPIWLFSLPELRRIFAASDLEVVATEGIHWATNLIPSTVLHGTAHWHLLRRIVRGLARVDGSRLASGVGSRLGCSVAFVLRRRIPDSQDRPGTDTAPQAFR